jgi:glutamate-1-semialdehyde 2,1-aminomutase
LALKHKIKFSSDSLGGMFGLYFCDTPPANMKQMATANVSAFKFFFHKMLQSGIYFAPSMYEAGFICITHDMKAINKTLDVADKIFEEMANGIA